MGIHQVTMKGWCGFRVMTYGNPSGHNEGRVWFRVVTYGNPSGHNEGRVWV